MLEKSHSFQNGGMGEFWEMIAFFTTWLFGGGSPAQGRCSRHCRAPRVRMGPAAAAATAFK